MLAEKSFQQQAQEKTSKWKFVRNAIPSIPGYSGLSMSADGLIGLKRNMGCNNDLRSLLVEKQSASSAFCVNVGCEARGEEHDI